MPDSVRPPERGLALLAAAAAFASALCLFTVEPLVAKQALPRFGGGPAVWTTCLVLFQTLLVAGYAWGEYGPRLLGPRRHAIAHLLVGLAACALLPPSLAAVPAALARAPVAGVLLSVGGAVALPFFVLSSSTSLVSRAYAARARRPPWFLFAASNLGSLVALVAYPLLVEPRLRLSTQSRLFTVAYAIVLGLLLVTLWPASPVAPVEEAAPAPPPSRGLRARWILRSATASLLLVAVSLRVSTDVSPSPLLWLVPLALYLAGAALAFWPGAPFPRRRLRQATQLVACVGLGLGPWWSLGPLWWVLSVPLALLALASWLCHGDLAAERPSPSRLGDFYLALAVGGCLGGLGGGLVAPLLFHTVAEYPVALALVCLVLELPLPAGERLPLRRALLGAAAWVTLLVGGALLARSTTSPALALYAQGIPLVSLLVALVLSTSLPEQLPIAAAVMACVTAASFYRDARLLEQRRSFFGVIAVREDAATGRRLLVHGTTVHGSQRFTPAPQPPSSYYHRQAPMGWVVTTRPDGARFGVVGLGTGAIAALLRPTQSLTYYEIDPTVEPLARRWFTYLADAKAPVAIVEDDARTAIAGEVAAHAPRFDLLVLDAFTSDAIPVHLLTVDALRLYLERITDDGVVLLHISNRHLDLGPLLAAEARTLGASVVEYRFSPTETQRREGAVPCRVVALARSRKTLAPYRLSGWPDLVAQPRDPVWTDERSTLLDLMR